MIKDNKIQPAIKWSGSKRSQAALILQHFPTEIDTYYEPFVGGGSILRALIENKEVINVKRYICSDNDKNLIGLWNEIKDNPNKLINDYKVMWEELNKDGDITRRRKFFNEVRERLNNTHTPSDFLFIMRTTTNGMPRYSKDGNFNNTFHLKRGGMNPLRLCKIILDWNKVLNDNNVTFIYGDYSLINPNEGDFCYLDPPYSTSNQMYFGEFNQEKFFKWLRTLKCHYAWSYNGVSGEVDNTVKVPLDLYEKVMLIRSGNSSFKRIKDINRNAIVYESLYLK